MEIILFLAEVVSKDDLKVVEKLENSDLIESITISGDGIDDLLEKYKDRVAEWNAYLSLSGF